MATPPHAHRVTRVTIMGNFGVTGEIWTTGFYMGQEGADAELPKQIVADKIRDAWATYHARPLAYISSECKFTEVKLSSVGTDGKSNAADTVYSIVTTPVGGNNAQIFPPQIALAATFTSSRARGVGAKGRMYLPGVTRIIGNDYKIDGTNQIAMLNEFKTFCNAVNAITDTPDNIILASHGSINKDGTPKLGGSSPINAVVTGIRLGNVYDTQRRRRNAIPETYQSAQLA